VERVEQCGRRTVITNSGIMRDGGPNSTLGETSNDTPNESEGGVTCTIGAREYCARTFAAMIWNNRKLDFLVFGWGPDQSKPGCSI